MSLEDLSYLPQQEMSSFDGFFNQNQQSPFTQNQHTFNTQNQHPSYTSDGLHSPGVLKPILEGKQVVLCPSQACIHSARSWESVEIDRETSHHSSLQPHHIRTLLAVSYAQYHPRCGHHSPLTVGSSYFEAMEQTSVESGSLWQACPAQMQWQEKSWVTEHP